MANAVVSLSLIIVSRRLLNLIDGCLYALEYGIDGADAVDGGVDALILIECFERRCL